MIGVANYVKAAKLIYIPRAENNEVSGPSPSPHLTAAASRDRGDCRVDAAIVQDPRHEDTLVSSPVQTFGEHRQRTFS